MALGYYDPKAAKAHFSNPPEDPSPARESHIPAELISLNNALKVLEDEFAYLAGRLEPVSTPQPTQAAGETSPEDYLVPLAAQIRSARQRVQLLTGAIRRAAMCLEL